MTQPQVSNLRLGTSSWSSEDWVGVFYPPGTPPADFLGFYSQHFDTVEADATFYRVPSRAMVRNWRERTPPGFVFAAKFPRAITHDKVLVDCDDEVKEFLGAIDLLGEKCGPLLLQFPYFNKQAFASDAGFLARLEPFLERLPRGRRFALEIRNKMWISPRLLDLLRRHNVAFALLDHPWLPAVKQLMARHDPITADFTYIRWLGDRKGIEQKIEHWDKLIVDRSPEMESWVPIVSQLLARNLTVYGYFNNHYGGYGPGSIELFWKKWEQLGAKPPGASVG